MDLKKLPPSMLVALGLGCGPTIADDDEAAEGSASATDSGPMTNACLEVAETTGPCLDAPFTTSGFTTGPCLDGEFTTTTACLGAPGESGSSSSSGTGTDTGTGTGTDTDEDPPDTATSVCLGGIAPDAPEVRLDGQNSVRERLIESGVLPSDVAERLKR